MFCVQIKQTGQAIEFYRGCEPDLLAKPAVHQWENKNEKHEMLSHKYAVI